MTGEAGWHVGVQAVAGSHVPVRTQNKLVRNCARLDAPQDPSGCERQRVDVRRLRARQAV